MGLNWRRGGRNQDAANGQAGAETSAIGTVTERPVGQVADGNGEDWDRPAYLRRPRTPVEVLNAVDESPPPAVVQAILDQRSTGSGSQDRSESGTWTRAAPTQEGWYGMRRPYWPWNELPESVDIVRVITQGEHLVLAGSGRRWVKTLPFEWLGPIVLPK